MVGLILAGGKEQDKKREGRYTLAENPKSEIPSSKQISIRVSDLGIWTSFTVSHCGEIRVTSLWAHSVRPYTHRLDLAAKQRQSLSQGETP